MQRANERASLKPKCNLQAFCNRNGYTHLCTLFTFDNSWRSSSTQRVLYLSSTTNLLKWKILNETRHFK
jgi:hypothetical protein